MSLETRIPPPVVAATVAGSMYGLRLATPGLTAFYAGRLAIALLVFALGVGLALAGVREFRRARTTVNPLQPEKASAIVDTGVFRVTRNPMYLGMLLALVAWTCWLANPVALAGPIVFVLYMNRFQIGPEERALTRLFGEPYRAYLGRVRRWI